MSCQQVPTAPAFNPYPRSVQVGEFEVAIGGGIWVAIGAHILEQHEGNKGHRNHHHDRLNQAAQNKSEHQKSEE